MRSFIFRALLFGLLQLGVLATVWTLCPRSDDHYSAAAIDKRKRLTSAPSPRLIFVGGSGTGFGFDSRLVEPTGYAPVNMGHNICFGLPFMLQQVAPQLRPGDVVVVTPEYPLLWGFRLDSDLFSVVEHDPVSVRALDWSTSRQLMDGGLMWMARKLRCALYGVSTDSQLLFTRQSFDAYGDFVAHRGRPRRNEKPLPNDWPAVDALDLTATIDALDQFMDQCEDAGARCVLNYPALRTTQYEEARHVLDEIGRRLSSRLQMPILGTPAEATYPPELFFHAGPYHLTEEGARLRTRTVIERLGALGVIPRDG